MAIKDEISTTPINIPKLLVNSRPEDLVDSLFTNFMYYAKANWNYIASARAGGEDLLSGEATQVPCGGIATALKILIEELLGLDVEYITLPGYVWTRADKLCFDRRVRGNVSKATSAQLYNEGCLFNEHYFIKCGDKYYDPCLDSIYERETDAVLKRYAPAEVISRGSIMAGLTDETLVVFNPDVVVPGWQRGAWVIVEEKNVLNYVTNKYDLLLISTKLKTGKLALKARKASKRLFSAENRLDKWRGDHRAAGIPNP